MRRVCIVIGIALGTGASAAGQAVAPPAGEPAMVRAAGMALNDGALPPGTLTVRVVQGAFTGDLTGTMVDLDVTGQAPLHAPAKAQGRAEFAHLPIGAEVRASAIVNGERLQSDAFRMPAESGVRILLIAGAGTAGASAAPAAALPPGHPAVEATPAPAAVSPAAPAADQQGVVMVRRAVIAMTALAFAAVFAQWWRRRRRSRTSGDVTQVGA
ncbi:MAG: hypothetical protein WC815_16560 [Vicinamibacterales bacterium]|jgi:hypothetical protein